MRRRLAATAFGMSSLRVFGGGLYGYSLGEFAMESEAFARFRAAADEAGIRFEASNEDFGPELTVVNVEGVKQHPLTSHGLRMAATKSPRNVTGLPSIGRHRPISPLMCGWGRDAAREA